MTDNQSEARNIQKWDFPGLWLGLCTSTEEGMGSIPGLVTKILQAT